MKLGISSAAAPGVPITDLAEGAARRGLSELEVVLDDVHGTSAVEGYSGVAPSLDVSGARLAALALPVEPSVDRQTALELAARVGLPLVVPVTGWGPPAVARLLELASSAGAALLLMHGTDPALADRLRKDLANAGSGSVGLAWEVDPGRDDANAVPAVLDVVGEALGYVRLRGGGPEAEAQSGMGVGALMSRLALARYAGPLVLTPSSPRYHVAWSTWLGRRGGWGCGSRRSDPSLVTIVPQVGA